MKALDALGWAKWPSVLLIVLFPILAYTLGQWPRYWVGERVAMFGPVTTGGMAVLLTHPADRQPSDDQAVPWTVHIERTAAPRILSAAVAYANDARHAPTSGWQELAAVHAWEWSGALEPPDGGGRVVHVWVRLRENGGHHHDVVWPVEAIARR